MEKAFSGWEGGVDYERDDSPPFGGRGQDTIVLSIPGKGRVRYGSGVPIRVPVASPEAVQLEVAPFGRPSGVPTGRNLL